MIQYSFVITVYISIHLSYCLHTQTNVTNHLALLSSCEQCWKCSTNMHCNYAQWIGKLGLPEETFSQNHWLKIVRTKSDCLTECRSHPQCNLYTYQI
ncbi:unnamed protein product, partial [Schistosoma guineensis]